MERIKYQSNYLRGEIEKGLALPLTGAILDDDTQLTKFHGIYQQDDRDLRNERRKQKLEPYYMFMVRVRLPGGVCTTDQWMAMDNIADSNANGTLKITTRQTFQLHGVIKRELKPAMQAIHAALMDTVAACGDVNRNVLSTSNPQLSDLHGEVYEWSKRLSEHLMPKTKAYYEIWLDSEKVEESEKVTEPMYGPVYLPRKFKAAVAIPPDNDVDLFTNCLGYIAIVEGGKLVGFNVTVGGGMGMTHGEPATYPRLADVIGFCTPGQMLEVAEQVVCIQRDYGDRTDRKHARLKYTIDDRGVDWFIEELNKRLGWSLEAARPYSFEYMGDRYGWVQGENGRWHYTLFIQNGRVLDRKDYPLKTGLREIAKAHSGNFRLTCNQNLIIADVEEKDKARLEKLLKKFGMQDTFEQSGLRLNSMACVAFPSCGLAMAESERYLPTLLDKLDAVLKKNGLADEPIVIRMTGCPNGCARPYNAEIAFVGKAPGKYNLYLGASFVGERLNKMYRENISEEDILAELEPMIEAYAAEREQGEHFGDFVVRKGIIQPTVSGKLFHD